MSKNIIHISDIHFGAPDSLRGDQILDGIAALFTDINDPECILLVTGDIAFQGNPYAYTLAKKFFTDLFKVAPFKKTNLLFCPGNHDIVTSTGRNFKDFDAFVYGLREDTCCNYDGSAISIKLLDDFVFVGINTAYRLDHTYGFVDIVKLKSELKPFSDKSTTKVAYFHHHILNIFEQDSSAIRNAYQLLLLLDEYDFKCIFHGHQHFSQRLPIGLSSIYSFGVRTVSYLGSMTGINTYQLDHNAISFKGFAHVPDKSIKGYLGGYVLTDHFECKDK